MFLFKNVSSIFTIYEWIICAGNFLFLFFLILVFEKYFMTNEHKINYICCTSIFYLHHLIIFITN